MSTTVENSSRKWHPDQEKLFLSLLSRPEYKPVGGDGDGVMERKLQARWEPLLECFVKENQALLAKQRKTAQGLGFLQEFNVKGIQSKYKSMKDKCMSCKRQFKVDRHQVSGETGAAADGQPATAQAAIDAATEDWPLFSAFHSAFGTVQRLRSDTWKCTASPFPKQPAAAVADAPARQRAASPQALVLPTRKRVPSMRARAGAACSIGSPLEVPDTSDQGSNELLDGTACQAGPSRPASVTSREDAGVPAKRSRLSARDMQLKMESSEGRMKAVEAAATLREASDMKLVKKVAVGKEALADRQEKLQRSIAAQHIDAAKLNAAQDRKVARKSLLMQEQAVEVQKEMLEEQKRHNKAKMQSAENIIDASLKNAEILELMRLYVGAGETPAEARHLARKDVLGK
jgi:hypothetical protein